MRGEEAGLGSELETHTEGRALAHVPKKTLEQSSESTSWDNSERVGRTSRGIILVIARNRNSATIQTHNFLVL